jgi:serine/threonine-protein kinase
MIRHNTGQIINDRYRVVNLLNQGGFGAVYRAWDMNLNAPCALKQNIDNTPGAAEQFAREASFLANLRHPNLPRVIDHFSVPGQAQYLVMDFISGKDLQEMVDDAGGPLPEPLVLNWIGQVMDALIYLHRQNPPIVHRDVKLANVRITPEGTAVLVDFGIAKRYDPDKRTSIGARATTPGYAPVEQYGQAPTDVRSDVYSLGATLYAALTAQVPPESILRAGGKPLTPPRQINPEISPNVEAAILKALAVMPDERYQSVSDLKAALLSGAVTGPAYAAGIGMMATHPEGRTQQAPAETMMVVGQPAGVSAAATPQYTPPTVGVTEYTQAGGAQPVEKQNKTWMYCGGVVAVLLLLTICGLGGWFGYSYYSDRQAVNSQTTGTQQSLDQTQMALSVAEGIQATQHADQTATRQAATDTPAAAAPSQTVAAAVTTAAPAEPSATTAASPTTAASLDEVAITEWGMSYFGELRNGCKEHPALCFSLKDNYKDTQSGVNAVLVSEEEVLIDPSWPSPHLVFLTQRKLPHHATLEIGAGGEWTTIHTFPTNESPWREEFFDLSRYKGKEILVRFSSYINGFPQSDWLLENVRIVPAYTQ